MRSLIQQSCLVACGPKGAEQGEFALDNDGCGWAHTEEGERFPDENACEDACQAGGFTLCTYGTWLGSNCFGWNEIEEGDCYTSAQDDRYVRWRVCPSKGNSAQASASAPSATTPFRPSPGELSADSPGTAPASKSRGSAQQRGGAQPAEQDTDDGSGGAVNGAALGGGIAAAVLALVVLAACALVLGLRRRGRRRPDKDGSEVHALPGSLDHTPGVSSMPPSQHMSWQSSMTPSQLQVTGDSMQSGSQQAAKPGAGWVLGANPAMGSSAPSGHATNMQPPQGFPVHFGGSVLSAGPVPRQLQEPPGNAWLQALQQRPAPRVAASAPAAADAADQQRNSADKVAAQATTFDPEACQTELPQTLAEAEGKEQLCTALANMAAVRPPHAFAGRYLLTDDQVSAGTLVHMRQIAQSAAADQGVRVSRCAHG